MKQIKLFDSELKLMELIWDSAPVTAKELAVLAESQTGWNKNTTYTVLKKLVEKKAVKRDEPNFICTPLVSKEQVRQAETESLINKLYDGSRKTFFAAFLNHESLSSDEIEELRRIIEKSEG
jgi:BlaI family transcriptional regulator, penicillinase repressor